MQKIKIIFFDIDDTLRLKDKAWMPVSVNRVFEGLHKNAYKTGIASGRAYFGISPEVIALGAHYYVTINGQYVETAQRKVIYNQPIARSVVSSIVEWAKEQNIGYGMVGNERSVVSKWDYFAKEAINIVYGKLDEEPLFWQTNDVYQLWTFSDRIIENTLPLALQNDVRLVRWHKYSCDVVPFLGSKAHGIEQVLNFLNLKPDELMVFGDGLNDLEMFDYAGFSVAMGNAHSDLKTHADFITKTVEDDGIAYALEMLGMIEVS
ncbi:MAG: hypothetical protein Ta2G_11350 [Termitinemataceae bacterium]|nr:MAG: hypothetical protein Ta2G_11350 [Termitinemataceae bacterium]